MFIRQAVAADIVPIQLSKVSSALHIGTLGWCLVRARALAQYACYRDMSDGWAKGYD